MKIFEHYIANCVTCDVRITTDKHGQSDQQPLWLKAFGGYGDMFDNISDHEDETLNVIPFCHKCGHRIIRLMGKGVINYIDPLSTTSHVRPSKAYRKSERSDVVGYWHFGWDNVTLRGYISAMGHYFRLGGFRYTYGVFLHLFYMQNWDTLNKSVKDFYPTNYKVSFIRVPRRFGLMIQRKIKKEGFKWY
tara:strand:- start:3111 stop:3680 length:570 start_codon:yes stop_codon:yes gene_type:complete